MSLEPSDHLRLLLAELGQEFLQIDRLKKFTQNTAVIGAHAEAAVGSFIRRVASPLNVSTGTIVDETNVGSRDKTPQIDTMLWALGTAPPLFQQGEFAIVPRGSCFGILEIKRSMYDGAGEKMEQTLTRCRSLLPAVAVTTSGDAQDFLLGVFCLQESKSDKRARELVERGDAIVLMRESATGSFDVDEKSIGTLVNFLIGVRALSLQTQYIAKLNLDLLE